ncbi:MAG: hypothetical protein LQ343_006938 [Gyalolechia ehrenbergii]|nr:MAG: hypothetical protein LQ343_006938 [Gyalolechia ehrenbergii]
MVQSSNFFGSEDQFTLADGDRCGGRKEYDANMIKLFSIAHLPKEPFPQRRDAFSDRWSTDWAPFGAGGWNEDGSTIHFENGPDSLLYEADQALKPDQSLVPIAREDSNCGSEGHTFFKSFPHTQYPSGACRGDEGCLAWGVELTPPRHQKRCVQAPGADPPRKLRKQDNTSPTITTISEENQSRSSMDEKKVLAHTVKERHRRLRISSAIKQIADLLGVHGSKVEILETAATWIGDAKSDTVEQAVVEDQAL